MFSWNEIPGNDSIRLIEFLTQKSLIDWVKNAEIEKVDKGKTIIVSTENSSFSLKINDKNTEVVLEIGDVRTDKFMANMEDGKLNIYLNSEESANWCFLHAKDAFEQAKDILKETDLEEIVRKKINLQIAKSYQASERII